MSTVYNIPNLLELEVGEGEDDTVCLEPIVIPRRHPIGTAADEAARQRQEEYLPFDFLKSVTNLTLPNETVDATTRCVPGPSSPAEKQLARKAIWKENTQKEIARCALQRRAMESLPSERVTAVKGKTAMSNMFTSWRDLLKDQRTSFLFHVVFPILHEEGYLQTNDILSCRKSSHEWKNSVEKHLQSWFKLSELSVDSMSSLPVLQIYFPCSGLERLDRFNSIVETGYKGKNPFISRKLAVELTKEHISFSLPKIIQLLYVWGKEIWQLVIVLTELDGFNAHYEEICVIMNLTPNLRAFCVSIKVANEQPKPYLVSDSRIQEDLLIWTTRIKFMPLPALPYLSLLSLAGPYFPIIIIYALLKKWGSTLTTVEIGGFGRKLSSFVNGTTLPHLREFSYRSYHTPAITPTTDVSKLSIAWPVLEKFSLFHDSDPPLKAGDVKNLFQSLNDIGLNFRHLTFSLLNSKEPFVKMDQEEIMTLLLKLPRLETLDFRVCNANLNTIDFILPLQSLKRLELCYAKYVSGFEVQQQFEPDEPGPTKSVHEVIQFTNYMDRLYDSNIWEVLPELKHVTIKVVNRARATGEIRSTRKQYTREGYRQHFNEKRNFFLELKLTPKNKLRVNSVN